MAPEKGAFGMSEELWNRKAAMSLDGVCASLDQIVNMMDAASALLLPLESGGGSPSEVEERYRLSDSVLAAAREILVCQADLLHEQAEVMMTKT